MTNIVPIWILIYTPSGYKHKGETTEETLTMRDILFVKK